MFMRKRIEYDSSSINAWQIEWPAHLLRFFADILYMFYFFRDLETTENLG